jgi:hypothetical protein
MVQRGEIGFDAAHTRGEHPMKPRTFVPVALVTAALLLSGCASAFKATEYPAGEVGEVMRAEPATVLSQRYVKIKNWRNNDRRSARRNGINYIIKIDRTGETLSVTQSADVIIPNGSAAWVEFGDRIRLVPRS